MRATASPTRHRRRPCAAAVVATALWLVLLTGCGIQAERDAHVVPDDRVPYGLLDADGGRPAPTAGAGTTVVVYFLDETRLTAVSRAAPSEPSLDDVLEVLGDGPTAAERRLGLTTSAPDPATIASVRTERGVATVDLRSIDRSVPAEDQAAAVAQVVFTLTARPGVGRVAFTIDGEPTQVPDGSGALTGAAVAREDFASFAPA